MMIPFSSFWHAIAPFYPYAGPILAKNASFMTNV